MSGTEEAAGTRPSPSLTRCDKCHRPLEAQAHIDRRCTYCNSRLYPKEVNHALKIWHLFLDLLPIILWIGFGITVATLLGVHYHG